MLTISDLSAERGERVLFKGLSFSLRSGQLVHLIGANGTGKSSFIKVLLGLISPLAGNMTYQGNALHDKSDFLDHILYLGHATGLNSALTAQENLAWYFPHHSATDIVNVLDLLGLKNNADQPLQKLSAGQERRVALARLWLAKKSIWLLDEPFAALDQATCGLLEDKIFEQLSLGGMVILVSHQALSRPAHFEVVF